MNRSELKAWAKAKREGHLLDFWIPIIILGAVSACTNIKYIGILVYFVYFVLQVGLIKYMVNMVKDSELKIEILWSQFDNFVNILKTSLIMGIRIFLWALLFIIPGVIKGLEYSMVYYLLADDNYKNKPSKELFELSKTMMNGHKMDLFVLQLSFIGWEILCIFTLGILYIWVGPWYQIALTKFMIDIKESYEGSSSNSNLVVCPSCGQSIDADSTFCTNCGNKIK